MKLHRNPEFVEPVSTTENVSRRWFLGMSLKIFLMYIFRKRRFPHRSKEESNLLCITVVALIQWEASFPPNTFSIWHRQLLLEVSVALCAAEKFKSNFTTNYQFRKTTFGLLVQSALQSKPWISTLHLNLFFWVSKFHFMHFNYYNYIPHTDVIDQVSLSECPAHWKRFSLPSLKVRLRI